MTTRSEIPGGVLSGAETDLGNSPGAIDAANLDRIAHNLLSAIPGAIVSESAILAASALASPAIPSVPTSSAVATPASLYSGTPDGPCLATEMLNAAISQMPIVTSAATSAVSLQSVLPGAIPAIPAVTALPFNLSGLTGGLPRMFDSPAERVAPASGAPSYYFLAPQLATPTTTSISSTAPVPEFSRRAFDVHEIRRDFPILQERIHGKQLVWLDNAATTQKPRAVIDRLV